MGVGGGVGGCFRGRVNIGSDRILEGWGGAGVNVFIIYNMGRANVFISYFSSFYFLPENISFQRLLSRFRSFVSPTE